jgi:hypothetical protein
LLEENQQELIQKYRNHALAKTAVQRQQDSKDKT